MTIKIQSNFRSLADFLSLYFKNYGGTKAILNSPFIWISVIITVYFIGIWSTESWWDIPIAVIPNLLGFTIAGFSILLAFGDERFRNILVGRSGKKDSPSPYVDLNASFLHFVIFQVLTILYALFAKSRPMITYKLLSKYLGYQISLQNIIPSYIVKCLWFIGFWLFIYALTLCIATVMTFCRLALHYDKMASIESRRKMMLKFIHRYDKKLSARNIKKIHIFKHRIE